MAKLYYCCWKIELFFNWIKQNLKIKGSYGTSKIAVLIQIWTALIASLLLVWGLLKLTRLVQSMLMDRCKWAAELGSLLPSNALTVGPFSLKNRRIIHA